MGGRRQEEEEEEMVFLLTYAHMYLSAGIARFSAVYHEHHLDCDYEDGEQICARPASLPT